MVVVKTHIVLTCTVHFQKPPSCDVGDRGEVKALKTKVLLIIHYVYYI